MPYRFWLALWFCGLLTLGAASGASALPSSESVDVVPAQRRDGLTLIAQGEPDPSAPVANPTAPAGADEPIGNVVTLTGSATVTRNATAIPLNLKDDIFLNDLVQTAPDSKVGITFNDATTFNLSPNSTITIDAYVFQQGGKDNAGLFDIRRGTVAFVAAALAKTGDVKITTATATMGIRGTTGLVEVPDGVAAAANARYVAIKLYPDPDGRVGRIEVNDRGGARLGALTLGASGFTIRPGGDGGRVIAAPLAISLQQVKRDQGLVRELHAAQRTGRRIVTQQRALRRANQLRNNPARPLPSQRRTGLPGQPGQPRQPPLPANANRPGQPQQGVPSQQAAPVQQPPDSRQPRLQRPGQPDKPAAAQRRDAPKNKRRNEPPR
jgi:hypothetical protein